MAKKHRLKHNKKLLTAIGVIVVLFMAAGSGMLVWWLQHKNGTTAPTVAAFDPAKEKLPAAIDSAQNTALGGNIDQSNQGLQQAIAQPSTANDQKYQLLIQLGTNYINQGKAQDALDTFKQAEAIKSTYVTSHLIAEQYEALGDKATAITYYKKTITQLDTSSPGYSSDKEDYEARIVNLGGQP